MLKSRLEIQEWDMMSILSHLVHLPICPISHDLDQLKDSCWILRETEAGKF